MCIESVNKSVFLHNTQTTAQQELLQPILVKLVMLLKHQYFSSGEK